MADKDENIRIGQAVRATRLAAEVGQAELSRRLGLKSTTQMWRYESGRSRISKEMLGKIAQELHCEVARLTGAVDGQEEAPGPDATREALLIAHYGLAAAREGTAAAIERFNAAVREHADRLRRNRPRR